MAQINESEIHGIVEQVVRNILEKGATGMSVTAPAEAPSTPRPCRGTGIFETVDKAVNAATEAFRVLNSMTLEQRGKIIASIRACGIKNARDIAERTIKETGMGLGWLAKENKIKVSNAGSVHAKFELCE